MTQAPQTDDAPPRGTPVPRRPEVEPPPPIADPQYASDFQSLMAKPVKANMRSIAKGEDQTMVTYDGREIVLSVHMLKTVMGEAFQHANQWEIATFIHYCMTNRLDPFRKQVFYIQYKAGEAPAFVTAWTVFVDRANRHPQFDGYESGIVWHVNDGEKVHVVRGQPCDYTPDANHVIAGGWARVFRRDQGHPRYVEVPVGEMQAMRFDRDTREKVPTHMWKDKQTTMCTKTPSARALRLAFPDSLGSLFAEGEVNDAERPEMPPAPQGRKQPFFGPGKPDASAKPKDAPPDGAESPFDGIDV